MVSIIFLFFEIQKNGNFVKQPLFVVGYHPPCRKDIFKDGGDDDGDDDGGDGDDGDGGDDDGGDDDGNDDHGGCLP